MVSPGEPTTVTRALPRRRDEGGSGFAGRLARYFAVTFRQAHEDGILLTASALAFVTIFSLIPLLAVFSFVGTRVFSQYPQRSLEVFVQILPYSDKSVVDKIGEFLTQAETIHGVGVLAFVASTLLLYSTVEEALNKIWNVSRSRPFKIRLLSFVLLLFWGPLLVGATFSSLILLRQSPTLRILFEESLLFHLLPFLATVVGLTTLYWIVPYTTVKLRNALAGGLLAGILLEMLRQGFGSYIEFFRNVNIVYGSFALALLFMISIELTWSIILFGAEASYTAQHFRVLARGLHRNPPVQASWVGLAALVLIARRFARGEPILSLEALAQRLSLPRRESERILHPLLTHNLLRPLDDHGYLLGTDPHQIPIEKVLAAYDHRARRGAELVGGEICERLEDLIGDLAEARAGRLESLTVADLLLPRPAAPAEAPQN
ncbi:MAG TPA: YhjD/YihY/BrkB family envelope integrity protein [Thermoanaerobaculia bacterium]|nr:YhjD/YihY/BrkB family envelope integrity protein [Thermoanaerobaculia bacterium]